MVETQYYFCETVTARPLGPWHIRPAGNKGRCPGGGADTEALCGLEMAWDLEVDITPHHLNHSACTRCRELYENEGLDER